MRKANTFDDLDCDIHFAKADVDSSSHPNTNEPDDDDAPATPDVVAMLGFDPDKEVWGDDDDDSEPKTKEQSK